MSKKKYKILNLYACLGGNRYKWDEVSDNLEITAVELDPELAKLYQERFPNDKVVVGDAHEYLINNYMEYDFIWTSPPCPTHSKARYWGVGANGKDPIYPDMKLYQEIILLKHHFKGKYVVENVTPYYEPMFNPIKRGRHLFWTNFNLPNVLTTRKDYAVCRGKGELKSLCEYHDYDFYQYNGSQDKRKISRNLVDYEAGKTILQTVFGIVERENINQLYMFP